MFVDNTSLPATDYERLMSLLKYALEKGHTPRAKELYAKVMERAIHPRERALAAQTYEQRTLFSF